MASKITPEIIPHNQFHKGIWLLPVERPTWYYFMKKKNENNIKNENFIQSVDSPLRELVTFLHNKKIKTTPSCSGHSLSRKKFEKIYSNLEKDKKEVRQDGLKLKDIERGKIYLYKNASYTLPWRKKDFIREVRRNQKKGLIGMRLKNKEKKRQILNLNIPGIETKEKNDVIFISTNSNRKWGKVTQEIKKIFDTNKY
jgi:hypothetical protein